MFHLFTVPIMVGNELFMLTQQDVRRVEDTRHMSYNRLNPNQFAAGAFGNSLNQSLPAAPINPLQNFISHYQQNSPMNHEAAQQTEEPGSLVANVTKQLKWAKSCSSSTPYPITYSVGTSTSGLEAQKYKSRPTTTHCSCQTSAQTTTKACNTEPAKKPNKWFKKQRSNHSLSESGSHAPQDQPSETTVTPSDRRRKPLVPPYCVVSEDYDEQQAPF